MNQVLVAARAEVEKVAKDWRREYDRAYRPAFVCLLEAAGGRLWIDQHPDIERDEPQILHGAGARMDEWMAIRRLYVRYDGTDVYISQPMARALLEATNEKAPKTSLRRVLWPDFAKRGGLIVVVARDVHSGDILMVAYTDEAGFSETLRTGEAVYRSTSRNRRWKKGEESGNVQLVSDILIDCDGDAIVYVVEQLGEGACHTGARSCFYRRCVGAEQIASTSDAGSSLEIKEVEVCNRLRAS